jgi:hypothetical protein
MSIRPDSSGKPTPYGLLQSAIKAVPAVKYALGGGGIVAVIVIIAGFKIPFRIAALGVVIMFVLMTVLVIFAHLSTESKSTFHGPAVVLMWFSVLLTMAIALAVFTSLFWGHWTNWTATSQPDSRTNGDERVARGEPKAQTDLKPTNPAPSPANETHRSDVREPSEATNASWILGTWSGTVQRNYERTTPSSDIADKTCRGKWTESYVLTMSAESESQVSGNVAFHTWGINIECWKTRKEDGTTFGDWSGNVPIPESLKLPLTVSASDGPNKLRIDITDCERRNCAWVVEKLAGAEFTVICPSNGCNLSLYAAGDLAEDVTRLHFEKSKP